jgi:hypothetical protein
MRKLKVQMNFEGINWDEDMVTFCIDVLESKFAPFPFLPVIQFAL